ncbi:MAG: alpha/beta hydrolase [Firmicutes bacterium]|nr:alpha/beta hydrolase [Bacillota bacterium]
MEQKSFTTAKGRIVYWRSAPRPGRPGLVFLPGLTADHRLFDKQVPFFEDSYDLLVWDAPGHGLSRPFELDFSLMDQAAWLHDILEIEGLERPVVVGQSLGGYVAQCYMERYPGSLAGFISIDSAPLQRSCVTAAELWLMKNAGPFYRAYPWQKLKRDGARGCAETEYGRALMRAFMDDYSKKEYCDLAAAGYRMLARAYEADLAYAVDCPALLVCGEKDRAGATKRYNKKWAERTGLMLAWISGAGHNSNTDRPEPVNGLIRDFLRDIGA